MLSIKDAASQAAKYLTDLVPVASPPLVEEVSRVGSLWVITLSYIPAGGGNTFLGVLAQKEYKVFEIDAETGEVQSMKIRDIKA